MLTCKVTPKIGTKHGFIVRILLLLKKTLSRVTVLTVLATATHYLNDSQPKNDKLMHLNLPSSGLF